MNIRCLIIDDEPLAQRVIERYAENLSYLQIVKKCNSAIEAIEVLHHEGVDLIFLDINMPKLTGIDFLRTLKNPPLVIITTAYAEYAIQGYELDVVDYLMKPFAFERFYKAVQKAEEILKARDIQHFENREVEKTDEDFIFVKSSKKTFKINLSDILYIEALGDYVKIHTTDKMIVSYQSLKNIETLLPPKQFPRIHKSFIIALSRIDLIEGNQVKIRDRMLPVGTNFKNEFERLIRSI
ncbi:MAG: LytTR family DNA-binding domain-containing protein [Bacteroidales bacterium]|nr:LytTR family DNA-binding domain-containing protein [Bacteroidales bacterium]HNW72669.1 LytTR family DNA-binding domain-containing protein [Bacteroidales bacterium]HPS49205.1 LytTR family DNA-binding domain-containing protein [Bacteroidales bacterium]